MAFTCSDHTTGRARYIDARGLSNLTSRVGSVSRAPLQQSHDGVGRMAARSARGATGKKPAAAKPRAARLPKAHATRSRRQAAIDPQARIAALEVERDRLAFELDTANEKIRALMDRQSQVIQRIDGIVESLHNLLDE